MADEHTLANREQMKLSKELLLSDDVYLLVGKYLFQARHMDDSFVLFPVECDSIPPPNKNYIINESYIFYDYNHFREGVVVEGTQIKMQYEGIWYPVKLLHPLTIVG